jgi:hypothetical protein
MVLTADRRQHDADQPSVGLLVDAELGASLQHFLVSDLGSDRGAASDQAKPAGLDELIPGYDTIPIDVGLLKVGHDPFRRNWRQTILTLVEPRQFISGSTVPSCNTIRFTEHGGWTACGPGIGIGGKCGTGAG